MIQIIEFLVTIWYYVVILGGLFIYIPFSVISGLVIPKNLEEKYSNPSFGTKGLGRLYGLFIGTGFAGPIFAKSVAFPRWCGKGWELEKARSESPTGYKIFAILFGTFALIYEFTFIAAVVGVLGYVFLIKPFLAP